MPNAKLKCCNCKDRFRRESMTRLPAGNFCSQDCIVEYAASKGKKAVKKQIAKVYSPGRSNTKVSNPVKTRKRAAKEACHLYVRTRDKNQLCICCDRELGENYQAGHYLESGNNPLVRYEEDNINGQRLDCNYFKGGDSGLYRVNLIKKIGLNRVLRLESMKGGAVKRTAQDYKKIEDYYKDKLKQLNSV